MMKLPNNFQRNVYRATGRSARFNLVINEFGNAEYQQETNANGEKEYYVQGNPITDLQYPIPAGCEYYNRPPISGWTRGYSDIKKYSKVRYYDEAFDQSKLYSVIIKLYKPLKDGLSPFNCTIDNMVRESYIDRVLLYDIDKPSEQPNFSAPNFKIDMGNYGKSQGTDLKSWNDLLDTNLSTSQQIVDKYISASFGNVNLNLDYTDFRNFVKYSSAVERVNNLKYKLALNRIIMMQE